MMRDVFRVAVLGLWAVSVALTVAVVLLYLDDRRRAHERVGLLGKHVAAIGVSYLLSTSLNAYQITERLGRKHFDAWSPVSMVVMLTGNAALYWMLRVQLDRLRARVHEDITDASL